MENKPRWAEMCARILQQCEVLHGGREGLAAHLGVPPDNLGAFLTRMQDVLQQHEMTASFLTHAATGQVHVRPFVDLRDSEQQARLWPLADAVYSLVLDMG